jgi:hypothetical protein
VANNLSGAPRAYPQSSYGAENSSQWSSYKNLKHWARYTGPVCHCHLIHGDLEEVQMLPGKLLVVSMKYQVLTENNCKKEKVVKRQGVKKRSRGSWYKRKIGKQDV